jgi:phospholipid-translocating ATPase
MSVSHQYHQPNAPDHADDDSDSGLDLELGELDPIPSSAAFSNSPRQAPTTFDFARRIPLRTLRTRRRPSYEDGDGEDTRSLLGNGKYDPAAGQPLHEDPSSLPGRRKSSRNFSTLQRIGSHLGLGPDGQAFGLPAEDEPEDDHDPSSNRTITVGMRQPTRFPVNAISNSRYTPWNFLPRTLYNEFKFFINMYFLLVALSQIIPQLRIGYLFSYILPLAMVLTVTLGKEAWDDIIRRRRDAEANSEPYTILRFDMADLGGKRKRKKAKPATSNGAPGPDDTVNPESDIFEVLKPSKDIKVGDVVKLTKNQRVPADMVILSSKPLETNLALSRAVSHSNGNLGGDPLVPTGELANSSPAESNNTDSSGETFIRTDQLDGETDWKLRLASPLSQNLPTIEYTKLQLIAGKPDKKVNEFVGTLTYSEPGDETEDKSVSLSVDNTAWANTVIASSSTVYGVVIYTGSQTRQALSTTSSRAKVGLLELEINNLTKILCILTVSISVLLVVLGRLEHQAKRPWYIAALRFLILFSTVIPISLRVNLDMGKIVYAWYIEHDKSIPETVVRTGTIPEDLGRIEYLLSDKTGTLTQNGTLCLTLSFDRFS